jgi:hypothetical protein
MDFLPTSMLSVKVCGRRKMVRRRQNGAATLYLKHTPFSARRLNPRESAGRRLNEAIDPLPSIFTRPLLCPS